LLVSPSAFLGRRINEVLPPSVAARLEQAFARVSASDEAEKLEYTLGNDDAEHIYEAHIARCDGDKILSIVRDITDRKRAELEADSHRRELAHLGRVAMLGEMSGALAHELSQPLTAVLINAKAARHLLDRQPLDVGQLRVILDDIIKNDKRAGAVIDRLRALLKKGNPVQQPVDVNEVAREVLELAYGELMSRRIPVTTTLSPALPLVLGDRVQLQQVLLNLVLNACDAMSSTPPAQRQLALSTHQSDGVVQLALSDRGTGVPEGQLESVFEPFVTFREQGLGLGLAIQAENNADGGATFRCFLPIVSSSGLQQAV
jgi:C4-dicarboxylate-specific signal transduction histidine kinase